MSCVTPLTPFPTVAVERCLEAHQEKLTAQALLSLRAPRLPLPWIWDIKTLLFFPAGKRPSDSYPHSQRSMSLDRQRGMGDVRFCQEAVILVNRFIKNYFLLCDSASWE